MKKHICKITTILLALLCVTVFPLSAFAAGNESVSATIPVSVSVSGTTGTTEDIPTETYTFQIRAQSDAPMPENDTLTIRGTGTAEFQINYSRVGVYRYTVSQDTETMTSKSDRGHYDESIYYVVVTVSNTENGLGVTVSAHKGSVQGEKTDIAFGNTYDPLPEPSPTPTPSPEPTPTPTPSTPTETKLIQTGQLNWPIPVLLSVGCLLVLGGVYAVTRKKEQKNG